MNLMIVLDWAMWDWCFRMTRYEAQGSRLHRGRCSGGSGPYARWARIGTWLCGTVAIAVSVTVRVWRVRDAYLRAG
jgi:apolipoprotein N-acyltransferase